MITGGTGFLGSSLALRHLESGDRVRVLAKEATDLESANSRAIAAKGAEVIVGDVTNSEMCRKALAGVDLVYHIAAAMREANVPDSHFREVNVSATERLLEAAREEGVSRFVYCSTSGVVGPHHGRTTDEDSECRPKDIYQRTKLEAEKLALQFARQHDFPLSAVRPSAVYGPGDGRLLKLFRMVKKGRFLIVGSGTGRHDLVHIADMVDGFLLAATKEQAIGRVYNIAGGEPIALNDLVDELARQLGTTCKIIRVPFLPMNILAMVLEFTCKPLGIQPPLYRRRLDFFRHDEHFDIARASNELGYQPKFSLAGGIANTIEGYRAEGLL